MKTAILLAQATEHHQVIELPMDPIYFGLIAFGILMFLMFVTMSWKGISHRH
ncbi:hypothetical protein [Brevibacterium otitidis]|uniref:Uncharacterized protein n=1 Tax=Brevibacterium otitidis TaxID=53364 RepID=A0ABV5WZN6_9MICO|nr:hypothetical protein GCM10023233_14800 [Brevibacterium otitidis]